MSIPQNNLLKHPKGCDCFGHRRDDELSKKGWEISEAIVTATRKKDAKELFKLTGQLEKINQEREDLRYGSE